MKAEPRSIKRPGAFFASLFVVFFILFLLTSGGDTPYNYFTRLADAFIHGRLYLTEALPWLSELIPGKNGYFVVYPPMPAFIAIPFVALFGVSFPQQLISHLLGAGAVTATAALSYFGIKKDRKLALWVALLTGAGSVVWFLSAVGSSWYLGQVSAFFFLTLALLEANTKKRPFLIGLAIGATYLSRVHLLLTIPVFLYLLKEESIKKTLQKFIFMSIGLAPFVLFNVIYNLLRFGVPWDQGYLLLPEVLHETNAPWFAKGVMNIAYLPDNIRTAFYTFPKITESFPYIIPSWYGLAIWITTPAFIFSFLSSFKKTINKLYWLIIIATFLFVGLHGGTGWAQFGYRFAVDFYPFLIFLTAQGVARRDLRWYHWILLFLGILVNAWGVVWINKFNWVGF